MTTISWPVRDQPVTHQLWREEFAGADGITDDLSGDAFRLTLPSTGDVGTISAGGKYRLRGFVLQVTVGHSVNLPAVASGAAKTYSVGVKYDPALEGATSGPLTIFALQKGTYTATGGVAYMTLWEITRSAAQVLSLAAVLDARQWSAATYYGSPGAYGGTYPVGARLVQSDGLELLRVPDVSAGVVVGTRWRSLSHPVWTAFPLAAGLTAYQASPQYTRVGGEVVLRGGVQRTNGKDLAAAGTTVALGTLPAGYRPDAILRIAAGTSFAGQSIGGRLTVGVSGEVQFAPVNDGALWTTLDGLRFFAPAGSVPFGA
jgi:hypothetical protein